MAPKTFLRTSKNTMMLASGTVVRMIASFAFALYCAALLGVEGFGKYSIAIFYFELFLSLAATAIGILLTRDLSKRPEDIDKLLTAAFALGTALCCIPPLIVIPIGMGLHYSADTIQAMGVGCLALVPATWCVILEAVFVTKERAEFVTGGTTFESVLRIALSFAVLMMGFGFVELVWVLVLTRATLLAVYWISLRRVAMFRWALAAIDMNAFAGRWRMFAAENWMATIYTNLDVLILSYISGEMAVGLYCAAWKLVRLGSVVAKSYTTAIFPVMSRLYGDSRDQFRLLCRHTIRVMSLMAIPAAVTIGVLADRIISLLFTAEYAAAAPILRVLIWVLLAEFLNPFLSHALFAQGKQRKSMYVAAISLAFNLVATYLLVRRFGAAGAAAGTVFSGLIATSCYLAFLVPASEFATIAWAVGRVGIGAAGLGTISYFLCDASWPVLVAANVVAFLPLMLLVQGLKTRDLALLKSAARPTRHSSKEDFSDEAPTHNVRVGLIGCGAIAECYHLPALEANQRTRSGIVLVDPNLARANAMAQKFNAVAVAADYTEVVDQVDAVIVATPPALHHAISKWFLERGIHVLCEKPLTEEINEAEELVRCGLENDAFLFVNQTRRFFPAYQKIRELLAEGVLGELQSIDYQDGIEFDWPAASPHHFKATARGAWSDTGVHLLDSVVFWLGGIDGSSSPQLVRSENDADGGPEAMATVELEFKSCQITIKVSRLGRLRNRFRIVGSEGFIESDAENWSDVVVHFHNGRRRRYRCDADGFNQYTDFAEPLIQNLVASVCGEAVPFVSGQSTLPTIRLLQAAYDEVEPYATPWNTHWLNNSSDGKEPEHVG